MIRIMKKLRSMFCMVSRIYRLELRDANVHISSCDNLAGIGH
jgi:hypothetical protein